MVFMPPCVISMEGESAGDADFFTEGQSSGESVALRLREVDVDSVSAPFWAAQFWIHCRSSLVPHFLIGKLTRKIT